MGSRRSRRQRGNPLKIKGGPFDKDERGEQLSKSEIAALRRSWWEQARDRGTYPKCYLCERFIMDFSQLMPEHKEPGKIGGCKDNSKSNLFPSHWFCNSYKASRRDIDQVRKELREKYEAKAHLFI